MNEPIVVILISAVFTVFVLGFIGFIGDYLHNKQTAEAKPVTTEVPEYIAKCSKTSFNRSSCVEFTIYRITRN